MESRECLEQLLEEITKVRNQGWRKEEEYLKCFIHDPVEAVTTMMQAAKAHEAAVKVALPAAMAMMESQSATVQNIVAFTNLAPVVKLTEMAVSILERALDQYEDRNE